MKKILPIFIVCIAFIGQSLSPAFAITIKKAAPVATQESSATLSTSSLVPTVLGLIGGIQELNAKQKELTSECIPTNQEINFVNELVKEWAKTGSMSAEEVKTRLRREPCPVADRGYENSVVVVEATGTGTVCYDFFSGSGNTGMVWENYPKVGIATFCPDGTSNCSTSEKKTVSDIYDIFNLIDFSEADYTSASEVTMAGKLMAKVESCSNAKLSAKKRAMWSEFLIGTISNMGQSTNTGTIMEQVGSVAGSGGVGALSSSLGAIATKFIGN